MAEVKVYVRSGIRTHAHRSGLRPERSALDLSAILTIPSCSATECRYANRIIFKTNFLHDVS